MKLLILSLVTIFISLTSYSQNVGIGTENPNSSALLELFSINSGLLIPKLNLAQRDAIASPAEGLLIYQTDNTTGFYYFNGTAWTIIGQGSAASFPGSGTAGQITFWTSTPSNTISGDDALFWDNTSKRLGIGTTSPSETLTVNGAIAIAEASTPSATSGYGKLYASTDDGQLWYRDDSGNKNQITNDYAYFEEQYSSGTSVGYPTLQVWQTRNINTTVSIKGNSISRSSNTISLKAGSYRITASAPAYKVSNHKIKLINAATGTTVMVGTSEYSNNGGTYTQSSSSIDGILTVSTDNTPYIIQHRCNNAYTTQGLGIATSTGDIEVYAKIYIQKLK